MSYPVIGYVVYLSISIGLTVWVGRTLFRHGRIFLVDTFGGNETIADAVNHLLVVGFYLLNIGYVTLALRFELRLNSLQSVFEATSPKLGMVMLILGGIHFGNLYIFSRMRSRALLRQAPPPVAPQERLIPRAEQG